MDLNKMMLRRSIFFPYIQSKKASKSWMKRKYWQFRIISLITFLTLAKLMLHLFAPENNYTEYITGDPFFAFGPTKKGITAMFLLWAFAGWLSSVYFMSSHKSWLKNFKSWSRLDELLKKGYFHNVGPFNKQVNIAQSLMTGQMVLSVSVYAIFMFFIIIICPSKFRIIYITLYPLQGVAVYTNIGMYTDFVYIYCLHSYLYSKIFQKLATRLKTNQLFQQEVDIEYLKERTSLYQEWQKTFSFYKFILLNLIWIPFLNHGLALFFLFFTDFDLSFKLMLLVLALVNFVSGFMFHYFFGSYFIYQVKIQK